MPNDAPIVLTREQHVNELIDFWRQQRIDRVCDDIIFQEEGERPVIVALREFDPWPSEPRPIDWTIARDLAAALTLNFAGLAFGGLVLWECLRP